MNYRSESLSFKRAKNRLARDLLPPGACLLVAHDEILIVNSREMEMKYSPIDRRLPHQTGVTERSISSDHWRAPYSVLDQVVIGHQTNRVGNCLAFVLNGHDHIGVGHKSGFRQSGIGGS
jgi:hypothetical protein